MTLDVVRDLVAGFGIAEDDNCYMGKMENKKQKSIGVYKLRRGGRANVAIGGIQNSSYETYPVSILVHWNKSPRETERKANELYEKLLELEEVIVNGVEILYCNMLVPGPQDVGTDEKGIYEMVVEAEFYVKRR